METLKQTQQPGVLVIYALGFPMLFGALIALGNLLQFANWKPWPMLRRI
jgi:hypothetical protein